MRFESLLLACLSIACGGVTAPTVPDAGTDARLSTTDFTSGTRLRARVYESADGARVFHDWYDTTLGAACELMTAEDGVTRCLPTDARVQGQFADPACTKPVLAVGDACSMPAFARDDVGCTHAVYAVGSRRDAGAVYEKTSSGACITTTISPGFGVYALDKKDPGLFASASETHENRAPGISMRYLRAEDGSMQQLGAWDENLGAACEAVASSSPLAGRCIPARTSSVAADGSEFSDPTCASMVVKVDANRCTAPAAAVLWGVTTCDRDQPVKVAKLGEAYSGSRWSSFGGSCKQEPDRMETYARVGVEVSVPLLGVIDDASKRIGVRFQTTAKGEPLFAKGFFDSALLDTCSAGVASDGVLRCLPDAVETDFFSDASCSSPVVARNVGCDPPKVASIVQPTAACGKATSKYFEIGDRLAEGSPVYYTQHTDHCFGPLTLKSVLYATTPLAPSDLAPLAEKTE